MDTISRPNTDNSCTVCSVSHRVVRQIATTRDRSITELPPLYETIDPDALDELVESADTNSTPFSLTFRYAGRRVTVAGSGTIHVDVCEQE